MCVTGTENFQHSALTKHEKSKDHLNAVPVKKQRQDMRKPVDKTSEISPTALSAQIGAAFVLTANDMADTKFQLLVQWRQRTQHTSLPDYVRFRIINQPWNFC